MEGNWEEFKERISKELEEAVKTLFQKTTQEIEEILSSSKSRIEEILKNFEDENLNPEKIKESLNEFTKEILEDRKSQLESVLKLEEDAIKSELDETREKIKSKIEDRLTQVEQELDSHIREAIEPDNIRGILEEKIKRFIEEETHIFEEEIKGLAKEVLEKNQKDIRKSIDKNLKAFVDAEDGLRKVIGELVRNQSDYVASELKEKISELISSSSRELLMESPLSERIAEVVGYEMKKYFSEIENLKSSLDILEMKIKILSESPKSEMETSVDRMPLAEEAIEIPKVDIFPEDTGVEEVMENLVTPENISDLSIKEEPTELERKEPQEEVEKVEPQISEIQIVEEAPAPKKEKGVKERRFKLETPIEVTYFGHAAFLISAKNAKILTDPYKHMALNNSIKYAPIDVEADFVTVSHMHMDQGAWKEIPGSPKLVEVAGEKTFADYPYLKFKGIHTYHDNAEGNVRGSNMVYNIEITGIRITHLGALGHILTKEQVREIGRPVDILIIPVGGYDTLPVKDAWEVVGQLDPLVVIPMRFKTDACDLPLAEVDAFTSLANCPVKLLNSSLTIEALPTSLEIWVMKPLKM
jgi:L-ascorbate metabolism protein UlaG (beta-lactamase superfamily)